MKKIVLVLLSFCLTSDLFCQDYKWQAELTKIDADDFYRIYLKPEIVSKLNVHSSDIRIKDDSAKEVPYFIEKESFSITKRVFKEYQVVEKTKWKNGATVLVLENKEKGKINNIQLQIKNFDVRKRLELAGSDDGLDWYTIKENYTFHAANGKHKTSEIKSLNFPYSDYKCYRIVIFDCFSLPINVLKVGYFDTYKEEGKFEKLTKPSISSFDSLETKQTYLKVSFADKPYFDKLVIKSDKPDYYYRKAKVCLKRIDKKGRVRFDVKDYITLNSDGDFISYFSGFQYKDFYIVVENEDNPPLDKVSIEAYQLKSHLVAHLESQKKYKLVFGNESISKGPNYDINHFKGNIADNITVLNTINLIPIKSQTKKEVPASNLWIWIAIGVVALLLGYISYKMILEMEKK